MLHPPQAKVYPNVCILLPDECGGIIWANMAPQGHRYLIAEISDPLQERGFYRRLASFFSH
jgi:hypothetical protein